MKSDKYLLIGGEKKYGSGEIVQELRMTSNYRFVSTNGMRLFEAFKLMSAREKRVIFFPSIAKWSFLRDLLIYFIVKINGKEVKTVLLCDLAYSKMPKLMLWTVKRASSEIFSPAKIDGVKTKKFSQRKIEHNVTKIRREVLIYGNYITEDKGFYRFEEYIRRHKINEYVCFGSVNDSILTKDIRVIATRNKLNFINMMHSPDTSGGYYFFVSKYDLAPLVIIEAIEAGMIICTLKSCKDSIQILKNYLGEGAFLIVDDDKNIFGEGELVSKNEMDEIFVKSKIAVTAHKSLGELIFD